MAPRKNPQPKNNPKRQRMRVAAYCRASTDSPAQRASPEQQIHAYKAMIALNLDWELAGIYTDIASGLRLQHREGYKKLLRDCKRGKIDMIIVKSMSRLGRDALELIKRIREWKALGITLYLETEMINTMTTDNFTIDVLAGLAQAESEARSEAIKFGIRQSMQSGNVKLNHKQFLGYTKDTNGLLVIVPEEAEIVRKIFELYLQGYGCRKIKRWLEEHGIKTVTGKTEWSTSTIDRILSSEKYIGDVLMQKTFTPDALGGLQVKNTGQQAMYLIENDHEPIIERETWIRVQEMKGVPLPEYMQLGDAEAMPDVSKETNDESEMKMY
jgi:DNA invertase Pin-like site-specific DNA recombinase